MSAGALPKAVALACNIHSLLFRTMSPSGARRHACGAETECHASLLFLSEFVYDPFVEHVSIRSLCVTCTTLGQIRYYSLLFIAKSKPGTGDRAAPGSSALVGFIVSLLFPLIQTQLALGFSCKPTFPISWRSAGRRCGSRAHAGGRRPSLLQPTFPCSEAQTRRVKLRRV